MFTIIKKQFISLITIMSMLMMVFGVSAMYANAAAAPNIVSYQGRLLDSNGTPVASTSLSMKFLLYDSLTGGTCLWSNSSSNCDGNTPASTVARTVTLTSGLFSAELGDVNNAAPYAAISDSVFGDNSSVYLEVEIDGETLTPRKQMLAAPYAINTQTLDGIDSTGFLASTGDTATGIYDFTGAVIGGGSPLIFEGTTEDDFESMFSFVDPTADRTLTFQDGSGTLAFMSDITSVWETGGNGIYENDAAVIVGADAVFSYASGGVNDLKVTDEFEALGAGWVGSNLVIGASTSSTETISDVSFSLDGDDLFVAGNAGIEGTIITDGNLVFGNGGIINGTTTAIDFDNFDVDSSGNITTTGDITAKGQKLSDNGAGQAWNQLAATHSSFAWLDSANNLLMDVGGEVTMYGDLSVRGGDLKTNQATFNLLNTTPTTVNFAGTATTLSMGNAAGETTIAGDLAVNGQDITTSAGALTINPFTYTRIGDATDPDKPTTTADSLFASHTIEVDGTAYFDGDMVLGDASSDSITLNSNIISDPTIQKVDPSLVLDVSSAGDTDFWLGVQEDADATDDDFFTIGDGTLVGSNSLFTMSTSGDVALVGDLAVNGDDITSDGAMTLSSNGGTLSLDASNNAILTNANIIQADAGLSIYTTGANILNLDSSTTGSILMGTAGGAKSITIGNSTGATAINVDAGTGGIDFDLVDGGPLSIDGDLVVIGGDTDGALATNDGDLYVVGQFEVDSTAQFDGSVDFGNTTSDTVTFTSVIDSDTTIQKVDPSLILDVSSAGDTDFWLGVQEDADGSDNDFFTIGDGTTAGANSLFTMSTSGDVALVGDLAVNGDDISSDGSLTINSSGAFALSLDSGTTGDIGIGTNANGKTITIGNSTGATSVNVNSGTLGINLTADTVTTLGNVGVDISVDGLTTGDGLSLVSSSSSLSSGRLGYASHTSTYTSTSSVSGNMMEFSRALAINDSDGGAISSLTLSSPVVAIGNNCLTVGNDVCITSGDVLLLTQSHTNASDSKVLAIDTEQSTETDDIMLITTDFTDDENNVFRIEADGEVFSDVGFTAGAFSTNFLDGEIQSSNNILFDLAGGKLTFDQDTTIGDGGDSITLDASAAGKTITIDSSDWDISSTGVLTGVSFDANGTGNSITNIESSDISINDLDFSNISNLMTLDADTSIETGAFNYTVNLNSTGIFQIQDGGLAALTVSSDGDTGITGGLSVGKTLGITPSTDLTGLAITGSSIATANLISLYPTAQTTGHGILLTGGSTRTLGSLMVINDASVAADVAAPAIDINVTGTTDQNIIDITHSTAESTGHALSVDMGTNLTGSALKVVATAGYSGNAIDLSDSNIGTALSLGGNNISGTTGNIDLTNFDVVGSSGNITTAGNLTVSGGVIDISGAASDIEIIDNTGSALTISEGGNNYLKLITTDLAEVIQLGNATTNPTVTLSGTGSFNCTDCINFDDLSDSLTLDANTSIVQDGTETFTISNTGTGNTIFNLASTGDFVVQDDSTVFATFSDDGGYSYSLNATDNPTYTITNNGTGNIITNLASTGDFIIQDNGTGVFTITDSGKIDHTPQSVSGTPDTDGSASHYLGQTYTDNATGNGGTASKHIFNGYGQPKLGSTSTGVTTTRAATLYVENSPTTALNQTITLPLSLWVDAGYSQFDDTVYFSQETNDNSAIEIVSSAEDTSAKGLINLSYESTTGTQSGDIIGMQIDQVVNLTGASGQNITGSKIYTNNLTASGASTTTYIGYAVDGDSGSLDTTDASATTIDWRGLNIEMPAINTGDAADIVSSYGVSINGVAVTDGAGLEDQVGLMLSGTEVDIASAPGQKLRLDAGAGAGSAGGDLDLHSGAGDSEKDGGAVDMDSGAGGDSAGGTKAGTGGAMTLITGAGGIGNSGLAAGHGGALNLATGNGGTNTGLKGSGDGGKLSITAGAGGAGDATNTVASGSGGALSLTAGAGGDASSGNSAGFGGSISLTAGDGGSNSLGGGAGKGGDISITAGSASVDGIGTAGKDGGAIAITSGAATASAESVNGGDITITTSNGSNVGTGRGGDLILDTGTGSAGVGGRAGDVVLITGTKAIPTSTSVSGDIHLASDGDLNMSVSSTRFINLGDVTDAQTIDIGGVDNSNTSTINIATDSTASDSITIGNSNALSTLSLTGGDAWNITDAGAGSLDSLVLNNTTVDLTSGTNEDLIIGPNGTGDLTFVINGGGSGSSPKMELVASEVLTETMFGISNSSTPTATDNKHALNITYEVDDATGNSLIKLEPTFTDNDADGSADSWSIIDIKDFTATLTNDTSGAITSFVTGLDIGAITETVGGDETITSKAISIGGNWDTGIEFQKDETIDNATDGYIVFTGTGGVNNNELRLGLDNTSKVTLHSTTTAVNTIQIDELLMVDLAAGGTDGAVCHDGAATDTDDVTLEDCSGAPTADYAEQYPVAAGITYGDIVVPGSTKVTTQDGQVISQLVKSSTTYQGPVAGIVSDNYNDFTSAGYNVDEEDNPMPVALVGRVPVNVTNENGSISVGDYLTTSSTAGSAMKATEAGRVIGMALNDFDGASGQVMVQVNNSWYLGNVLSNDGSSTLITDKAVMAQLGTATAENQTFDSYGLALRGSAWDGSQAQAVEMMLVNQVTDTDNYRLSIHNNQDAEVAYITNEGTLNLSGDLVLSGKIYPSDQGTAQTDKYIYYDGSAGAGGDFMRTNAKGWSTGSYDFAEMFPSTENLQAGDVVSFAGAGENVSRSTSAYDKKLAGIVSTRPGFLAGENLPNSHPIALAGRVPTKVIMENGSIKVGDPLTSSSTPGYAMKAKEAGPIIGYALEPYNGGSDTKIIAFVNSSYWGGEPTDKAPGSENNASGFAQGFNANYSALNMSGNIYMTGNEILGAGKITSVGDSWELNSDGTIKTEGLLKTVIDSYQNTKVETVAVTSPEVMITLSGTTELVGDEVEVRFENVAPEYNDVISAIAPIRVVVTANGPVSLYIKEKDQNHFVVKRFGGEDIDVEFDWMVTAYRKGYEPEEDEEEIIVEEEENNSEVSDDASEDADEPTEESVVDIEENDTEEVLEEELEVEQVENSDEAVEEQLNSEELEVEEEPATQESPDENQVDSPIEDEGGAQAEEPSESDVEEIVGAGGGD